MKLEKLVEEYKMMDFVPVMPVLIEKVGEVGAEGNDLSVFAQGEGATPMASADIPGLLD